MEDIPLSLSRIRQFKLKVVLETADAIKRNCDFPPLVVTHFDEKRRKQHGECNDFLAVCVTGTGLSTEKLLRDIPLESSTGAA